MLTISRQPDRWQEFLTAALSISWARLSCQLFVFARPPALRVGTVGLEASLVNFGSLQSDAYNPDVCEKAAGDRLC